MSFSTSHSSAVQQGMHRSLSNNNDIRMASTGFRLPNSQVLGVCKQFEQLASSTNHVEKQNKVTELKTANQLARHTGDSKGLSLPSSPAQTKHFSVKRRQSLSSVSMQNCIPSKLEVSKEDNDHLDQKLVSLQAEHEQLQAACDAMLTELITTQESLASTQKELEAKDCEISTLQSENKRLNEELQRTIPVSPRTGQLRSSSNERELRDLQSKCDRLLKEVDRRDEQLRQVQERTIKINESINLSPLAHAQNLQVSTQPQPSSATHQLQLEEWKSAYDTLCKAHSNLQRSHSDLSEALSAQNEKQSADEQQLQKLQASHEAELADARRMSDFFQQHSEELSRKNKTIVQESLMLQDKLDAVTLEFEQQKSLMEAMQMQVDEVFGS